MNMKNVVKVVINGKDYSLSGYESEEYLQKIAGFLNSKQAELSALEGYTHLDSDHKTVLMQINLADAYYKMMEERDDLRKQLEDRDKEVFDLKHELISLREEERGKKHK